MLTNVTILMLTLIAGFIMVSTSLPAALKPDIGFIKTLAHMCSVFIGALMTVGAGSVLILLCMAWYIMHVTVL